MLRKEGMLKAWRTEVRFKEGSYSWIACLCQSPAVKFFGAGLEPDWHQRGGRLGVRHPQEPGQGGRAGRRLARQVRCGQISRKT